MAIQLEHGLSGLNFGATVAGLTLDDVHNEAVRKQLWNTFIQDGMIVFKDMQVTPELHVELSRVFGDLAIHPLTDIMSVEGFRELIQLKYDKETETIWDVDGERLGGYVPWHFDGVFVEKINRGGILRCTTMPESGGTTGFMDGIDAYDRLPTALKEKIEDLSVAYQLCFEYPYAPRHKISIAREGDLVRNSRTKRDAGGFPVVSHPLVFTQEQTGRKVLNFSPMFALYILGMDKDESHELLLDIGHHITDERYAYFHQWESSDELVVWDNWRLLHKASGVPEEDRRAVCRTTIAGDYGFGKLVNAEEKAAVNAPTF